MALQSDSGAPGAGAYAAASSRNIIALIDGAESGDLLGIEPQLYPLIELCRSNQVETPFALALVGGRGAGKRFAARTLADSVAAGAGRGKPVVVRVDAAAGAQDGASAIAAATFAALEAADYTQLADEAAHAAIDPRNAAAAAAERHDEALRRLEEERRARDEVEGRRARLVEALLFDMPGGRLDTFVRSKRGRIESRLRSFGFGGGDAATNFRHLVGDLAGLGPVSRLMLFLRALVGYRGQLWLIVLAILSLGLAVGLDRLASPGGGDAAKALLAPLAPALDWLQAHGEQATYAVKALIGLAALALLANLWRAARFTALLSRGASLLAVDIRERRADLDASAARLERRVAALQLEADTARQRAEALAGRAGAGAGPSTGPPGPASVGASQSPTKAARNFLQAVARISAATTTPAPQRLVLSLENLDLASAAEARRLIETAVALAPRGTVVLAAFDPARLGPEGRGIVEDLFEIACGVEALAPPDCAALTQRLLSGAKDPSAPQQGRARIDEPYDETEMRTLAGVSALIGDRPAALKRLVNAYRVARIENAPRGAVALALAARLSGDPDAPAALRHALFSDGDALVAPTHPPALAAAFAVALPPGADKAAWRRAWNVARRYAPWPAGCASSA